MKITKNHSQKNFSGQFDSLGLRDIIEIKTKEELLIEQNSEIEYHGLALNQFFFDLEKVKPMRYIWHVSRAKNRESILKTGLLPREGRGGVWANNQTCIAWFYPFAIDFSWIGIDTLDYWRIDTQAVNAVWRVDPYMLAAAGYRSRKEYVCTLSHIPPQALQVYNFELKFYTDQISKYFEEWKESMQTRKLRRVK